MTGTLVVVGSCAGSLRGHLVLIQTTFRHMSPLRKSVGSTSMTLLILLLALSCSKGSAAVSAPTSTAPDNHALSGSIGIIYAQANGAPVLQEVESLLDDQQVGHESFAPGTDRAFMAVSG